MGVVGCILAGVDGYGAEKEKATMHSTIKRIIAGLRGGVTGLLLLGFVGLFTILFAIPFESRFA